MTENRSGLHPRGRAVLIEPYEPEIKSSAIALPDSVRDKTMAAEMRAIVIEVGPHAWADEGVNKWVPAKHMGPDGVVDQNEGRYVFIHQPRAKVGDKVMVAKFAGSMVVGTADGKQYRVCNCNDIFLVVGEEQMKGSVVSTRSPMREVA